MPKPRRLDRVHTRNRASEVRLHNADRCNVMYLEFSFKGKRELCENLSRREQALRLHPWILKGRSLVVGVVSWAFPGVLAHVAICEVVRVERNATFGRGLGIHMMS
jgi:hypothetical protein